MNVGTLSPQQLRSLVEDKWQRDDEALAVGLHVTSVWRGPAEVEFDFGKAQVIRADTVFQVARSVALGRKIERPDRAPDQVATERFGE